MDFRNELKAFSDVQMTSKDGKTIVPALVRLVQNFQGKITEMFSDMFADFREEFLKILAEKDEKIATLESDAASLKKQVAKLEEKIDENDAYERRDTLVLSGSCIPPTNNMESCPQLVCDLAKNHLQVNIRPTDISVAHRLSNRDPRKQGNGKLDIIVKFCRRDNKLDLLNACRKKKPENLFVNEFLTPPRQSIAYVLRKAKKEFPSIISGSTSFDGKVFVWVKPPNAEAPGARAARQCVNSYSSLVDFCSKTLKKPVTHFINEWTH